MGGWAGRRRLGCRSTRAAHAYCIAVSNAIPPGVEFSTPPQPRSRGASPRLPSGPGSHTSGPCPPMSQRRPSGPGLSPHPGPPSSHPAPLRLHTSRLIRAVVALPPAPVAPRRAEALEPLALGSQLLRLPLLYQNVPLQQGLRRRPVGQRCRQTLDGPNIGQLGVLRLQLRGPPGGTVAMGEACPAGAKGAAERGDVLCQRVTMLVHSVEDPGQGRQG
eukprot:scaffold11175_cov142-Isochrysis_galbana.AAC.4